MLNAPDDKNNIALLLACSLAHLRDREEKAREEPLCQRCEGRGGRAPGSGLPLATTLLLVGGVACCDGLEERSDELQHVHERALLRLLLRRGLILRLLKTCLLFQTFPLFLPSVSWQMRSRF